MDKWIVEATAAHIWTLGVLAAVIAIVLVWLLRASNRLVLLDSRCEAAFSDIDAQLKHRHNLIPPLVETVRGFANHESGLILDVLDAQARAVAAMTNEMKLEAEGNLTASLSALFSSVQAMPDIRAESHFQALRNELIDCENRITAARRYHALIVSEFNTRARQWPASMFVRRKGLSLRESFNLGSDRTVQDQPIAIAF